MSNVYELPTRPSSEEEGGASVPFARALGPDDFDSGLTWVDYCIVMPSSTIGVHQHVGDEGIYFILEGEGMMAVDEVGPHQGRRRRNSGR